MYEVGISFSLLYNKTTTDLSLKLIIYKSFLEMNEQLFSLELGYVGTYCCGVVTVVGWTLVFSLQKNRINQ